MSSLPPVTKTSESSEPRAERGECVEAPPEPFGQLGIGRYVLPVLAALSLVIASASGTMWYRSYHEADTFERSAGGSVYRIRSIVGRVLYYRLDFDQDGPFSFAETGWNYSSFSIVQSPPDGWKESWQKALGVEWNDAPLAPQQ